MNAAGLQTERKLRNVIVTRLPNVEVIFFWALLNHFPYLRELLDIVPSGPLFWEFVSAGMKVPDRFKNRDDVLFFNTGGKDFDQHGRPENDRFSNVCSLDLVRQELDFTSVCGSIKPLYEKVRANDLTGQSLSRPGQKDFRHIITGLMLAGVKTERILIVGGYLMRILFEAALNDRLPSDPFSVESLRKAIAVPSNISFIEYDKKNFIESLNREIDRALHQLEYEWKLAKLDLKHNVELRATVKHPRIGRALKMVLVYSDSYSIGPHSRQKGIDILVVIRPKGSVKGHVQIFARDIFQGKDVLRLDLAPVAHSLRKKEIENSGRKLLTGQNISTPRFAYWQDREGNVSEVPWYLAEFRSAIFNGAISNMDVPRTNLSDREIFRIVKENLRKCHLLTKKDGNFS